VGAKTAILLLSFAVLAIFLTPCKLSFSVTSTAPTVSLSATRLSFGDVTVGTTSVAHAVTLKNIGNATLIIENLLIGGINPSDFAQTSNCAKSVAAGGSCTIGVIFAPHSTGLRTATLIITDDSAQVHQTVSLTGVGIVPAVSLYPTQLSFASRSAGTTSAAQTVTVMNVGIGILEIANVAITGTNAGDFAQTNTCGTSVTVNASCTISVTFTPTANGRRTASLSISNNARGSPQTVALSGTGTAPAAGLSSAILNFASQAVGTSTAAQTVSLGNTGSAPLSITSITITGTNAGDFAQINTCGSSVAAGNNCTISVTFTPTASGTRTASVGVSDNASGSPQRVALSGTGAAPAGIGLSPTSLSFGSQPVATSSALQTITVSNNSSTSFGISGLAITGTNSGDFAEVTTCGNSLAAGATCTIGVTFTPSATGPRAATLSVIDTASGSPPTASFTGTGSPDVILSWSASPSSGILGYNVYRGTASGGEGSTPLNSTPISGTTYVDANVTAGTTYYYFLTSLSSNGVQSSPSNETEARVPST
jgi:hypothetical protein